MLRKPALLLLLVSCALPVFAESFDQVIDTKLDQCKNKAQNTVDINECYRLATTAWDAELNKQYLALLKENPESVGKGFRESQRQWIKYRDAYNEALNTYYRQEQGTIWSIVAAESKMNVIRDKALDLYRVRESVNLGN